MSAPIPITPGVGSAINSAAIPVDVSKASGELPFADLVTNLMQ